MAWTSEFHCDDADFCVRAVPDDVQYAVQRSCMSNGSEVFRDMFTCCDLGFVTDLSSDNDEVLDLNEPADILVMLLRVLHTPPSPPSESPDVSDAQREKYSTHLQAKRYVTETIIPLPLLPILFRLADKYILSDTIVESLGSHLRAHAPTYPLQVYGLATALGFGSIVVETSKYLLHPPLSCYSTADVKVIPTVEAYHKLVLLHLHRINRLREVLLAEPIFPHGYGACSAHQESTTALWKRSQRSLAPRIEAATDVAAEMASISQALQYCKTCHKACTAAVEMLAYKCRRIPRSVGKLNNDGDHGSV